jgi:hypothetical protein
VSEDPMSMAEKRNSTKEEKQYKHIIWKGREHGWKCRREVLLIGAFLTLLI